MFSQTNEYALRVVTYLAFHTEEPCKNADIAKATQVPPGYLYKVLQVLDRAGLVHGQRGMHGGFKLARPAKDISVYDIISAVDPLPRVESCPLHIDSHCEKLCTLHTRLDKAFATVEEAFRKSTVAELLKDSSLASRPLDEMTPDRRAAELAMAAK